MKYNPVIHHRRSIRIKGYDYSRSGVYFITICTQDRLCLFGEIKNGANLLNDAGRMANKWWHELKFKYQHIKLHGQNVMPNHFHGIIEIHNTPARSDPGRGRPMCLPLLATKKKKATTENGQTHRSAPTGCHISLNNMQKGGHTGQGGHTGPPLHAMVQWFKTMTTNEYIRGVKQYNWHRFNKRLWQRNYYEHIIRSEKSYQKISEYIKINPLKWREDKYYVYGKTESKNDED